MSLTYGSVCSGIEAASVAWHLLGWKLAWVAEVDKAASQVLAHRFPDVANLGDMTLIAAKVRAREVAAPDVLVGGTPCQSFSVAGLRGGLSDTRGQLTIAFIDLANAIDEVRAADGKPPVIVVWENVPGVLNHADNPFGCFAAGLAGDDDALEPGPRPDAGRSAAYWTWDKKSRLHRPKWSVAGCIAGPQRSVAWRTFDAQWFGLAQRRNRVFVVASARAGFDTAGILLEFDGLRRDSAPSREPWESAAGTLDACTTGGGFPGTDGACSGHVVAHANPDRGLQQFGGNSQDWDHETENHKPAVDVRNRVHAGLSDTGLPSHHVGDGSPVSQTLDAVLHKGQTMPEKNRFPAVLQPIHGFAQRGHIANFVATDVSDPLRATGGDCGPGSEVIAFSSKDYGAGVGTDLPPTLRASGHDASHANGGSLPAVTYAIQERAVSENTAAGPQGKGWQEGVAFTPEARHHVQSVAEVLPFDTTQITHPCNRSNPQVGDPCHPLQACAHPPAVCVTGSVTHTLKGEGFDASEDGTGRGQPIVAHGTQDPCVQNSLAFALGRNQGQENAILQPKMAVRRLMPVECERLQGFDDNWTRVPVGKKQTPAADGPRYKQLGNSMPVPVMRHIGERIDAEVKRSLIGHNGGPVWSDDEFDALLSGASPVALNIEAMLG